MYYGCEIKPHALILMKPLAGIGNVAANEKYSRPGGYPTSLDVLRYLGGSLGEEDAGRLNDKFWKKFDGADWGKTKFIITYMIEDDFESGVYDAIIPTFTRRVCRYTERDSTAGMEIPRRQPPTGFQGSFKRC